MKPVRIFLTLLGLIAAFATCIREEPEIPAGATNFVSPDSATWETEIVPDSNGGFWVRAELDTALNLNIVACGWVWGTDCNNLNLGRVEDMVTGNNFGSPFPPFDTILDANVYPFEKGVPYYFKPFIRLSNGSVYYGQGACTCSFLGAGFNINTDQTVFKDATVSLNVNSVFDKSKYTFQWNFGSTAEMGTHVFTQVGDQNIELQIRPNSDVSCSVTKVLSFNVIQSPFPDNFWVMIPADTFWMGCVQRDSNCGSNSSDWPRHKVHISKSYFIGRTEITQKMWKAVMGDNNNPSQTKCDDCPVQNIAYQDVVNVFIPKLNRMTGRQHALPTEAEWEYAARGGQTDPENYTLYAHNDGNIPIGSIAVTGPAVAAVGSKLPNGYVIYDFCGNVSEFCSNHPYKYPDDSTKVYTDPPNGLTITNTSLFAVRGSHYATFSSNFHKISVRNLSATLADISDNFGVRLIYR